MPYTAEIDTSELTDYAKALDKTPAIVRRRFNEAMRKTVATAEAATVSNTPVNTGSLRGSITTQITGTPAAVRGIVKTPLIYGVYVEHGRKPGKRPPIGPIRYWVIRKLGLQGTQANAAAYAIAAAIGRRGTRPRWMFTRAFFKTLGPIIRLWERVADDIIRDMAKL